MPELTKLRPFCQTARNFWQHHARRDPRRVILVEAMSQDLRVTLRNLSVANALSRLEPADVVVYSGADAGWSQVVWSYFDLDAITRLCEAYGATDVVDVHALVDARVAGATDPVLVHGLDLAGPWPDSRIDPQRLAHVVQATTARMAQVPRTDDTDHVRSWREVVAPRAHEFARVYDAMLDHLDVVALVSSHVDYDSFGLAVEAALRHDVPVLFPQSTGGLKVYGLWPEQQRDEAVRAGLTTTLGAFFEDHVWRHHELLRPASELTTHRSKQVLGRPSWWRPGRAHSAVDMGGPDDRAVLRRAACSELGLDPDRPVVAVFNHAVSDALGTNVEAYPDLATWFEQTLDHAVERDDVGWLFLDHPSQALYDSTEFFATIARRHQGRSHLAFARSMDLSKNTLVAVADTVLTVRGSVSNEYPALGIPAIQTGWSEWSDCGFTTVVTTPEAYVSELDAHLETLHAGRPPMSEEQVERARLWTWFYRAGADVTSPLVPPWQMGQDDAMLDALAVTMLHVEADADPLFTSVHRLWTRRDPALTRADLTLSSEALADSLGWTR